MQFLIPKKVVFFTFSITKYEENQFYGIHSDNKYVARSHTILIYLNTVPTGGETIFPFLENVGESKSQTIQEKCLEDELIKISPEQGYALLWENLDEISNHGSCPVLGKNEKWILQAWAQPKQTEFYCTTLMM